MYTNTTPISHAHVCLKIRPERLGAKDGNVLALRRTCMYSTACRLNCQLSKFALNY